MLPVAPSPGSRGPLGDLAGHASRPRGRAAVAAAAVAPPVAARLRREERLGRLAEQVLQAVPALLDAGERQAKIGRGVADQVVRPLVVEPNQHVVAVLADGQAGPGQARRQAVRPLLDLDRQHARPLRERRERRGPQQPAGVDRQQVVADALDLAEQVRGHHDGDAELVAGPPDQLEHLVATGRIEAVRRLVEEEQPRVVDERLGQLDALLHAGRVAADLAVALLVQPDVAEDLGRPLARGVRRQPRDAAHVGHELGRRHVGRQAVVLGHVADELADLGAVPGHVQVEHDGRPAGRRDEAEQDLDQRRLAGAVRADQADDARLDVERQLRRAR